MPAFHQHRVKKGKEGESIETETERKEGEKCGAHLLWVIRVRLKRRVQLNERTEWGEGRLVDCKGESQGVRPVWACGMSRGGKVAVSGYFVKEHCGTP